MEKEEVLTVTFCSDGSSGEAGLAVFKEKLYDNGDKGAFFVKIETGAQASDLHYLLTNQAAKVEEIKVNKSENRIMIGNIKDMNISKSMQDSIKELVPQAYHTCARCKYERFAKDLAPCKDCIRGVDNREDLWEAKEDE